MAKNIVQWTEKIRRTGKAYRAWSSAAYAPLAGRQRTLAVLCNAALSLYIAKIAALRFFADAGQHIPAASALGAVVFCAVHLCIKWLLPRCGDMYISCRAQRDRLPALPFFAVFGAVLAVFTLHFAAHYPGGITPDTLDQWAQIQTGAYNNWHPAIHTLLLWLVTRIAADITVCILVQIVCFAAAAGYMAATLRAWGIDKRWAWLFAVAVIAPRVTRNSMLFPSYDSLFTITILLAAVCMLNITLSGGKWLAKWRNMAALAALIAAATLLRHNGFFFTLPLALALVWSYRAHIRAVLSTVAAAGLLVLLVLQALYPAVGVSRVPSRAYMQSVGLPMTILSGVKIDSPQALTPQARVLLDDIADDGTWQRLYQRGNFNSIRYLLPIDDAILQFTPAQLVSITLQTALAAPRTALSETAALTRMVWDPLDWRHDMVVYAEAEAEGLLYSRQAAPAPWLKEVNIVADSLAALVVVSDVLTPIGLHMLLLLLAGVYSVNRNWKGRTLLLLLPCALYVFGTMLLLFGPEYRVFHWITVASVPMVVTLLARADA